MLGLLSIGIKLTDMFDILVAGEINPDLILSGNVLPQFGQVEKLVDSAALTIGSSSAIFACGAARLGLKVAFIGVCGEDVFGRFMLEEMQKRQVDTSHVIYHPTGSTGLSVILNQKTDRAILTYQGLIDALSTKDIDENLLAQCRHLHVASYYLQTNLQPGLADLFKYAHSRGLSTSLDTNYDPSETWCGLDELLPNTDVFLPNQIEALAITDSTDVSLAAKNLSKKANIVAVKLGAQGALANNAGVEYHADSIPVAVTDTIGAGDSFDAGFLFGYLNLWPIEKSLRMACVCGALSTVKSGGTAGQPTLQEALKYVS